MDNLGLILQRVHFQLDILAFICILDFLYYVQPSNIPIWFGASFCILSIVVLFLDHFQTVESPPHIRSFLIFYFLSRFME